MRTMILQHLALLAECLARKYPSISLADYLAEPDEYPKLDAYGAAYHHGWLQGAAEARNLSITELCAAESVSRVLLTTQATLALELIRRTLALGDHR